MACRGNSTDQPVAVTKKEREGGPGECTTRGARSSSSTAGWRLRTLLQLQAARCDGETGYTSKLVMCAQVCAHLFLGACGDRTSRSRSSRRHLMARSVSLLSAMRDIATPGPFCVTQCLPWHHRGTSDARDTHGLRRAAPPASHHTHRGVSDNMHRPVPRVLHLLLLGLGER